MRDGAALSAPPELIDLHPPRDDFRADVLAGLSSPRRSLPCKYLYDELGSELFARICQLDEYYPTRTERAILRAHAGEMAEAIAARCLLIEPGAGAGEKAALLLERLRDPVAFAPIEIAREPLWKAAATLSRRFPRVEILPVCADFTADFELPAPRRRPERRAVFFPGSTIGNFAAAERLALLRRFARLTGPGGGLLIGLDLERDPEVLRAAYDDREGVTAAFNLNLLRRINREFGADFDLDGFAHAAPWNAAESRVEMHLVSRRRQTVRLDGHRFAFAAGETIHTENCHKFELVPFAAEAGRAGFRLAHHWQDPRGRFCVAWFQAA